MGALSFCERGTHVDAPGLYIRCPEREREGQVYQHEKHDSCTPGEDRGRNLRTLGARNNPEGWVVKRASRLLGYKPPLVAHFSEAIVLKSRTVQNCTTLSLRILRVIRCGAQAMCKRGAAVISLGGAQAKQDVSGVQAKLSA